MCERTAGTLLVACVCVAAGLDGQTPALRLSGAGAGLYFGKGLSGLNGPVLFARWGTLVSRALTVGLRVEYRDDDNSGGRSQALSGGGEVHVGPPTSGAAVYAVLGIGADIVSTSRVSLPEFRDIASGVYPRVSYGLGVALGGAARQFEAEWRTTSSTTWSVWSLTAGVRGTGGGSPDGATVRLTTGALFPSGTRYAEEPDYSGYALAFEWPWRIGPVRHLRAGLGIDFVTFGLGRTWSTGVIQGSVGASLPVMRPWRGALILSAVPHVGAAMFAEPDMGVRPLGGVDLEGTARLRSDVGVTAGMGWVAGSGPAGGFSAWRRRFGVVVGL